MEENDINDGLDDTDKSAFGPNVVGSRIRDCPVSESDIDLVKSFFLILTILSSSYNKKSPNLMILRGRRSKMVCCWPN